MRLFTGYGEYAAEVMADSVVRVPRRLNPVGYARITTVRVILPRMVLAELNTHRSLSRSSASSRAVGVEKMIHRALELPFIPDRFPRTHKGMQATSWVTSDDAEYNNWTYIWLMARDAAVAMARLMNAVGISKQLANRLLEPFQMHEVIITATEWENFLALRAHEDAQNEIRIAADLILKALNSSYPVWLEPGDWHLPYGDKIDYHRVLAVAERLGDTSPAAIAEIARKITVARCARVSYYNFDGKDDYEADVALYDGLLADGHMSPFEHVAQAMSATEYELYSHTFPDRDPEYGCLGNLRGFKQLRRMFPREKECRSEPRLLRVSMTD